MKLLSAKWLMKRAGFEPQNVERQGRRLTKWSATKRDPLPLPCRQVLEKQSPQAYLTSDALENLAAAFREVVSSTKSAEKDGVDAAPVVVISHCWEEKESPDPTGSTLRSFAAELGRQLANFAAWGFDDIGVFFDWSSCYQDTVDAVRTQAQTATYVRAVESMPLLYAHKQSTVFLVADQKVDPPRNARGWPYYEESLVSAAPCRQYPVSCPYLCLQ